ncbi:hypothetical protein ACFQZZ_07730 [Nocardia sp. GCM10030253]|uniref:hypothetical protein n=1 Tax=Nocardia sp. GCM10030253 TaxID=3273404 RepID=UPI0036316553
MAQVKLIFALWGVGDLLTPELATRLRAAGAEAVQVNVSDAAVADAMVRLTAFDSPIQAVVSVWTHEDQDVDPVVDALGSVADRVVGWRVEAVSPIELPVVPIGERAPGLSNIAFLRRPDDQPYDEWLNYWRNQHTEIAIATQATFGYVQNRVLGAATDGAPEVAAVIEELFPIEALTDPHAFYGSGGDNAELARRFERLMDSVAKFGANKNIDVVPTSRYRIL